MDALISALKKIDESDLPDGDGYLTEPAVQQLASVVLRNENGEPRYTEIDALYAASGYFVLPVMPRTARGWLGGAIRTKKGLIRFE